MVISFYGTLFQKFSPQALKNLEIAEEKPDFEDVRFLAQTPSPLRPHVSAFDRPPLPPQVRTSFMDGPLGLCSIF